MDTIEISDKTLRTLAESAERFIGYLYAGVLVLVILTIEDKDFVETFVKSTGGVLTTVICISAGIGLYTIYFRIFGELLFYPIQHLIHILLDILTGRWNEKRTSTIGILSFYGVKFFHLRSAYEFIKEKYLSVQEGSDIRVSHGELHVLYLTALILAAAYLVLDYFVKAPSVIYLYISAISYVAAVLGDTRQHIKEAFIIKANRADIVKILRDAGYIK